MARTLKVTRLVQTCQWCPSQWDAFTDKGEYVYIRYRWGRLTVELDGPGCTRILDKQIGDGFDGVLSEWEMQRHTKDIIEWATS